MNNPNDNPDNREPVVEEPSATKIEWWVYVVIICSVFSIALVLNYIVKRINDTRQRVRVNNKRALSQSVQYHTEAEPGPLTIKAHDNHIPGQGVSLVFNKEDNIQEVERRKEEVIEDEKKIAEDKRKKEEEVIEDASNVISISEGSGSSHDEYIDSIPVSGKSSPRSTNIKEAKPAFLGKIYQHLHKETKIKEKSTSKDISKSKEKIPVDIVTTDNQVEIDESKENSKVENNEVKIEQVGHTDDETDKVEQNEDVNHEVEHEKNVAIDKLKMAKDSDSILKEILERTILKIKDSKSN